MVSSSTVGELSPCSRLSRLRRADVCRLSSNSDAYDMIQFREVPTKTVEEIREYAQVFWERYTEIEGEFQLFELCRRAELTLLFFYRPREGHQEDRGRRSRSRSQRACLATCQGQGQRGRQPSAAAQNHLRQSNQRQVLLRRGGSLPALRVGEVRRRQRRHSRQDQGRHQRFPSVAV